MRRDGSTGGLATGVGDTGWAAGAAAAWRAGPTMAWRAGAAATGWGAGLGCGAAAGRASGIGITGGVAAARWRSLVRGRTGMLALASSATGRGLPDTMGAGGGLSCRDRALKG